MEEIGIQHDLEADGGRHHDAVPQSKAKEFRIWGGSLLGLAYEFYGGSKSQLYSAVN